MGKRGRENIEAGRKFYMGGTEKQLPRACKRGREGIATDAQARWRGSRCECAGEVRKESW